MKTILNLFLIMWKAPKLIGSIKSIMDIVGCDVVQRLLEAIKEALGGETIPPPNPDGETEPAKRRRLQRIKTSLGLKMLNLNEAEYSAFQSMKNIDEYEV